MPMPSVKSLIERFAPKYGLDPRAATAVAMGEGGLRYGAVGDQGTSYGPFQLHVGGALPAGRDAAWANSPAGIEYALRRMSEAGARGLVGKAAINAIVRNFERPANPDVSVQRAIARLPQLGVAPGPPAQAATPNPLPSPERGAPRPPTGGEPVVDETASARRRFLATLLTQNNASLGVATNVPLVERLAAPVIAERRANAYGGTTKPAVSRRTGTMPRSNSPGVNRVLEVAQQQIGKPYVWGAESPSEGGFDCSGLIDWAYKQAGIDFPGRLTTYTAMNVGKSVAGQQMRPGDLLITNGGKHMVMYVGGGQVIAAPRTGEVVQYQPVSRFQGDIVDVRRVLGA